jgi:hypothetical protein
MAGSTEQADHVVKTLPPPIAAASAMNRRAFAITSFDNTMNAASSARDEHAAISPADAKCPRY